MSLSIVFTGGGTAGHVTPNVSLINFFKQEGWYTAYLGSEQGIEKSMIQSLDIPFYAVRSGKLRRYFSLKNMMDPFRILVGIVQSFVILRKLKPAVVFSKGGFVAFPVVVGAWLNRIPVIAHESDMTPGLANRLSFPFVNQICLTFEATKKYFKRQDKLIVTGTPIRQELFSGNVYKGLELCGFTTTKPCLLVVGGSLGAGTINSSIRGGIHQLIQKFQVIHICGKGKSDPSLNDIKGYQQFDYVDKELPHLFAAASIVISRAGANSLYEILALGKPHILVPLSAKVSRGDQIHNARYFEQLGISKVLSDDTLNPQALLQALYEVMHDKTEIERKIKALNVVSATEKIVKIIKEYVNVQQPTTL